MHLIRYRKLSVILIPIGEGEVDNVITRKRDIELEPVGREAGIKLYIAARGRGDLHYHFAEVLGEDDSKYQAVDCSNN